MASPVATENLDLPRAMIEVATTASEWVIILPTILCMLGAALLLMVRNNRGGQASFAGIVTLAVIICDAELLRRTFELGPQSMTMGKWLPPFGISFTADTMSAGFALASAVVALAVILYSHADIAAREVRYGFYPLVLLLLAGVTGAFMTGDLFNLYVWFELMLIASFGLLIMGGRKAQLDGAVKYGFINFLATTFFLIALGV
jgi:multicomponent Na+:H+ antiporter subunit D